MLVCFEGTNSPNSISEILRFLRKREVANIRTFRLNGEGFGNPHLLRWRTDVLCERAVRFIKEGYVIMVEDFNPEFTIFNGNLTLHKGSEFFEMDFCVGRNKTVRLADKYLCAEFEDLYGERIPYQLCDVVHEGACLCSIRPVLLEWSWSVIPQGRRLKNTIFWEYRSIDKPFGY